MAQALGKGGAFLTIATAVAMSAASFWLGTPEQISGNVGICFPSPNQWQIVPAASWIMNLALILIIGGSLSILNRNYSIVHGTAATLPCFFMIMAVSLPWTGATLTSAPILAAGMTAVIAMLCSCYKKRNATQEMFIIATILSLGSLIQYAFIPMLLPVIGAAILFKCLHFREIIAIILGLIAPYWIVFGLGITNPLELSMPTLTNLFDGNLSQESLFVGLLNLGTTAMVCTILALYNGMKLYAGNTRRRVFNMGIDLIGISCILCMLFDADNLTAYTLTFYVTAAFQYANLFALWSYKRPWTGILLLCAGYVAFFTVSMI